MLILKYLPEPKMIFIYNLKINILCIETSLEKWYSDDSDSDQDTGVMDKLAKAVTHLISEYVK